MQSEQTKILVVDDDKGLRELLSEYLQGQGLVVDTVADGKAMHDYLDEHQADLIVLDIMLPGEDGLTLARNIRKHSEIPILMLSARGEDIDRIVGLEVGADDYLAKPFNPRELLARIRAILRRKSFQDETEKDVEQGHIIYRFGDFSFDVDSSTLLRNNEIISLTSGDKTLLQIFLQHPNRILSRDWLIDTLKGYDRSPFDRSVDVRVTRLRRKIEADHKYPEFIQTVWGEGYRFCPNPQPVKTE